MVIEKDLLRKEFSRLNGVCYLDHVGSALYSDSQIECILNDLKLNLYGNPHSLNTGSRLAHDTIDQVRFRILNHFNTNSDEYHIIFTSGATESLKLVTEWFDWKQCLKFDDSSKHGPDCCCKIKYDGTGVGSFVYMRDNHTSVLGLREIANSKGIPIHCIAHNESFQIFNKNLHCGNDYCEMYYGNSLFVYSAQCNFSGIKYPLDWIQKVHSGYLDNVVNNCSDVNKRRWFCLLDAATYVSTNLLDLSTYKPDFVAISFYKIFGYPTGLGAILVKNSSICVLNKKFYGGGTVLISLSDSSFHVKRPVLHERSEDGTVNFLSIMSLLHGFNTLHRLAGNMNNVSYHVFTLAKYLHDNLLKLHHSNGFPVVKLYHDTDYSNISTQGNIVNFNILRSDGTYLGYFEVLHLANLHDIYIRTGCFCNPGTCQRHMQLKNDALKANYEAGHTCATNIDLINGRPTGSIRVSFGYMSDVQDADRLIKLIVDCFVSQPLIIKFPENWQKKSALLRKKFYSIKDDWDTFDEKLHGDSYIENIVPKINSFVIKKRTSIKAPSTGMKLSKIFLYPIKSCGSYEVNSEWPLCETGLKYDRKWMIVNHAGTCVSQKKLTNLCFVKPIINLTDQKLYITYDDLEESKIAVPLNMDVNTSCLKNICIKESKVCGDTVQAVDCGDEIASWLSEYFGVIGLRLVMESSAGKKDKTEVKSFSNVAQILLLNEASINWFAKKLEDYSSNLSPDNLMQRFRSNFVISGDAEPSAEQFWTEVTIGSVRFKVEEPCFRCQIICIDQFTGEKNKEVLTTLSSALNGKITFGVYMSTFSDQKDKNGVITVRPGDTVIVN